MCQGIPRTLWMAADVLLILESQDTMWARGDPAIQTSSCTRVTGWPPPLLAGQVQAPQCGIQQHYLKEWMTSTCIDAPSASPRRQWSRPQPSPAPTSSGEVTGVLRRCPGVHGTSCSAARACLAAAEPPQPLLLAAHCRHLPLCACSLECLQQWCRTRRQPKCPLCWAEIASIEHGGAQQVRRCEHVRICWAGTAAAAVVTFCCRCSPRLLPHSLLCCCGPCCGRRCHRPTS